MLLSFTLIVLREVGAKRTVSSFYAITYAFSASICLDPRDDVRNLQTTAYTTFQAMHRVVFLGVIHDTQVPL
jgi:hypothetical protein